VGLENHVRMVVFYYNQKLDQILEKNGCCRRYRNLGFLPRYWSIAWRHLTGRQTIVGVWGCFVNLL